MPFVAGLLVKLLLLLSLCLSGFAVGIRTTAVDSQDSGSVPQWVGVWVTNPQAWRNNADGFKSYLPRARVLLQSSSAAILCRTSVRYSTSTESCHTYWYVI